MAKQFSVTDDTDAFETFEFRGSQKSRAEQLGAVRFFVRNGNQQTLPAYIQNAVLAAGYAARVIGWTTNSHTVWGLIPSVAQATA